jgi:hypothetical protein
MLMNGVAIAWLLTWLVAAELWTRRFSGCHRCHERLCRQSTE